MPGQGSAKAWISLGLATGKGNGVMADRLAAAGAIRPVDLAGDRARARTDGELYWLVTNGIGFMPRFGPLLTEDERWLLVPYMRALQGR